MNNGNLLLWNAMEGIAATLLLLLGCIGCGQPYLACLIGGTILLTKYTGLLHVTVIYQTHADVHVPPMDEADRWKEGLRDEDDDE